MINRRSGFTMLELIMVVIIIGVLAALAVPQYTSFVEKARAAEAINYIGALKSASIAYAAERSNGYYPANLAALTGMAASTPLWSYSLLGSTNVSVAIAATRTGGPGGTIILTYVGATGTGTWTGTHSGVPKQ